MHYKVKIENDILMARIDGHHSIWMYRAPRSAPSESKPGLYILIDDRGYCCYVGETDNFKSRMRTHESTDKFCWWSHSIFFWDDSSSGAFNSTDDRRWYEKQLKEFAERNHPTFTKSVQNKPKPLSGDDVLSEMLALLNVIGFDVKNSSVPDVSHKESMEGEWLTNRRGIVGRMRRISDRKYEVLPGSDICMNCEPRANEKVRKLRLELQRSGHIVQETTGRWKLKKTVSFTSPSSAAVFVLGGSVNGWDEWKNAEGKKLQTTRGNLS